MPAAAPLPDDIEALKRLIAERDAIIAEQGRQAKEQYEALLVRLQQKDAEASNLTLLIDKLKLQIAMLKRARFGASSEKLDLQIAQLELIVEELEAGQGEAHAASLAEETPIAKAVPVRKALPEHLPRETITHAPACACPSCGGQVLRLIGTDSAEMLEYVPERFKVIRHERPKYACDACDTLVQVPAPSRPIAKGFAGPGLLAHVLISKYADHLPLYRQSEMLARQGIEISRSTLADWVGATSALLSPLVETIRAHVVSASKLHTDDTPVPVLQPGRGTTKLGRLWTYVRDDRNSGDTAPAAVWFRYSPDRKGLHPQGHLKNFTGFLQADAYAGYESLYGSGKIKEVACWAHARRPFYEFHAATGSPIALEALQRIAQLYAIEDGIRGKPPDERRAVRQARAGPLLIAFKAWLQTQLMQLSRKADLAKAIQYALGRWAALTRYLEDGTLEIDNNIAENTIRPIALGKKNWLFAGSDEGGQRAANLYSLLGTAKLNGLNPQAYLTHVLARIGDTKVNRVADLLPWNVAEALAVELAAQ
jgi:transposase